MIIRSEIEAASRQVRAINTKWNMLLAGVRVRILSKYNGQPFGISKKPLTGETRKIEDVNITAEGVYLRLEGERLYIGLEEVDFV